MSDIETIKNQFTEWWLEQVGDSDQWTTLERRAAYDAWMHVSRNTPSIETIEEILKNTLILSMDLQREFGDIDEDDDVTFLKFDKKRNEIIKSAIERWVEL